jgi:SPP1 family predicted phage head-tail adaptor
MLSDAELTAIRADVERMLPDTCAILAGTQSPDGYGGITTTWGTVTTCACRIDPLTGREALAGGAVQPYHAYIVTLPYGTTVTEGNRVEIGGTRYTIKSVDAGKSWAASVRLVVEKL